VHARTKIFSII